MANRFVLRNDTIRRNAMQAIIDAGQNCIVTIAQPTRSNDQNAMFHALCSDIAKSGHKFAGKARTMEQWKALLISGHAVATDHPGEVIPGLEGEFVAIRESSARMGVARAASLITYTLAYCDTNGIPLAETHMGGFLELQERAA